MFKTLWNAKRFLIKLKYQVHNKGSFTNLHLIKNNQSYLEMTTYQNKLMVQAILVLFKALKINLNEDFPKDQRKSEHTGKSCLKKRKPAIDLNWVKWWVLRITGEKQ